MCTARKVVPTKSRTRLTREQVAVSVIGVIHLSGRDVTVPISEDSLYMVGCNSLSKDWFRSLLLKILNILDMNMLATKHS